MCIVLSVVLRKGGGGKTTTAVNLASALHQKGHKTLLVDLDDQANATISVGINPFSLSQSINTLFTHIDVTPKDVIVTTEHGLSVLPATEALAQTAAGMSATQIGVLKPIIAALRSDYEYIVIDTPPSHSYLSISALVASDKVLIPLQTHYLAMDGLARVMEDIRRVKNGLNPSLEVLGILPTMVQPNTNIAKTVLENVKRQYAHLLLPVEIRYSIKHVESSLVGQPIVMYAPSHEGAQEYVKLAEVIYDKTK